MDCLSWIPLAFVSIFGGMVTDVAALRRTKPDSMNVRGLPLNKGPTTEECAPELFGMHDPAPKSPISGIDAFFVLHYTKLSERRKIMEKVLQNEKMNNAVWVTWYDKGNISSEEKQCLVASNFKSKRGEGAKSLALKHFWVYNYVVQHKLTNAMVLEDDAMPITPGVLQKLEEVVANLPQEYDRIELGTKRNAKAPVQEGPDLNKYIRGPNSNFASTSSYILSQSGAQKMMKSLVSIGGVDRACDAQQGILKPTCFWTSEHLYYQNEFGGPSLSFFK